METGAQHPLSTGEGQAGVHRGCVLSAITLQDERCACTGGYLQVMDPWCAQLLKAGGGQSLPVCTGGGVVCHTSALQSCWLGAGSVSGGDIYVSA